MRFIVPRRVASWSANGRRVHAVTTPVALSAPRQICWALAVVYYNTCRRRCSGVSRVGLLQQRGQGGQQEPHSAPQVAIACNPLHLCPAAAAGGGRPAPSSPALMPLAPLPLVMSPQPLLPPGTGRLGRGLPEVSGVAGSAANQESHRAVHVPKRGLQGRCGGWSANGSLQPPARPRSPSAHLPRDGAQVRAAGGHQAAPPAACCLPGKEDSRRSEGCASIRKAESDQPRLSCGLHTCRGTDESSLGARGGGEAAGRSMHSERQLPPAHAATWHAPASRRCRQGATKRWQC